MGHPGGSQSDCHSGHDFMVREVKPRVGLCADSSEPGACFGFWVSLSAPTLLVLSLSLSKINIKKFKTLIIMNSVIIIKCKKSLGSSSREAVFGGHPSVRTGAGLISRFVIVNCSFYTVSVNFVIRNKHTEMSLRYLGPDQSFLPLPSSVPGLCDSLSQGLGPQGSKTPQTSGFRDTRSPCRGVMSSRQQVWGQQRVIQSPCHQHIYRKLLKMHL